jgi:hypothetical protein
MPNYVQKQLVRYRRRNFHRKQFCPFQPAPINYGQNSDELINEPESPAVGKENEKYIRGVVGSFLYYARAVDLTILTALSDIASEQSKRTEKNDEASRTTARLHAHQSKRSHPFSRF